MIENAYSLNQLESLCDNAPCGMGIFESFDKFPIYLNTAYYKLVGYTREEYKKEIANLSNNLIFPEDTHITEKNIIDFNTKPQNLNSVYRIKQKSGDIKWISLTVTPFLSDDKEYGLCFFEDITAQKENLAMLKVISDYSRLSISMIKVKENEYSVVYANDKFFELVGITREEYMKNPQTDINYGVSVKDRNRTYLAMKESLTTGEEREIEYLYKLQNGESIYLSRRLSAIKSFDKSVLLLSITTDITEKKLNEMKIKEEHNRFQMVVEEMNIAVFEWNIKTGEFYSTGNYNDYAMSDVDNKLLLHNEGPLDLVHPDDIPELLRYAEEAKTGAPKIDAILRLRLKKGGYRWVHISAIRTYDNSGELFKTTGVVTDASREKNNEIQLQHIINNVPTGISIYEIRKSNKISSHYHNETYYKMLGYTKEEYTKKTKNSFLDIIHPDDIETVKSIINDYALKKSLISVEIRMLCNNGKYSWFKIDGKLIREDNEKFTIYECFVNIDEAVALRKKEQDDNMKNAIDVFNYLYSSDDIDYSVNEILKHIGKNCNVSRAYIFEDDDNHKYCTNTFEWCSKGVLPQKDKLQQVFYADLNGDYRKNFDEDGVFNCPDINTLPQEVVDIVKMQNIKSMLQCSIVIDKTFNGYIGFDECREKRNWTKREIEALLIVSKIICIFLKRRKAEKLNEENNEKLSQIVKSIPGGVAIYKLKKNGLITTDYVSSGLAKMCGYTQEEFYNILKDDAKSNVAKEDVDFVTNSLDKAINLNQDMNIVYQVYNKDKSKILIRLNASLVKNQNQNSDELFTIYGVHTVVTDYEQRLINQQEQNKVILDRLDIAYFGWTINEKPYYSEQFKRYAISQEPMEKIMSNSAGAKYVHPDDIKLLEKFFKDKNPDDSKTSTKIRMKMMDGSYRFTLILRFSEHDKKGNLISALGVFMDVDEEWIEQNTHLKNALKELEKAKKSKELFFSQMSHDLRTPLNAVINLSSFAKENLDNKKDLEDYIDSIYSSGQLLLGLVNDGLNLEKANSGEMVLNPTEYSYEEFKKSIITIIEPLCRQKNIQLDLSNDFKNYYILADKTRFEQIFINLFSNAVKFTPAGGKIEFFCQNKNISENIFECDFVVRDNGIGMSKEFQKKMFLPFTQENTNEVSPLNGTGLGLSIVYQLVKLMNGTIVVNSEKGKGTEFIIHLAFPYIKNKSDNIDNIFYEKNVLNNKHILLVEDHPLNAKIAIKILEKWGCIITYAENGQIAIDKFTSSKPNTFSGILMDIRMPVMDGLEATSAIRALPREDSKTVPIIAMSANAFEEDVKKSLSYGMNAHLSKPIEPEQLRKCLQKYINN